MTEHEQTLAKLEEIRMRYDITKEIGRARITELNRIAERYRVACQYLVIACGLLLAIAVCGWMR